MLFLLLINRGFLQCLIIQIFSLKIEVRFSNKLMTLFNSFSEMKGKIIPRLTV